MPHKRTSKPQQKKTSEKERSAFGDHILENEYEGETLDLKWETRQEKQ